MLYSYPWRPDSFILANVALLNLTSSYSGPHCILLLHLDMISFHHSVYVSISQPLWTPGIWFNLRLSSNLLPNVKYFTTHVRSFLGKVFDSFGHSSTVQISGFSRPQHITWHHYMIQWHQYWFKSYIRSASKVWITYVAESMNFNFHICTCLRNQLRTKVKASNSPATCSSNIEKLQVIIISIS